MNYYIRFLFVFHLLVNFSFAVPGDQRCPEHQISCANGRGCLLPSAICDLLPHCEDLSDENDFHLCESKRNHSRLCGPGMISCYKESRPFDPSSSEYQNNKCYAMGEACLREKVCVDEQDPICQPIKTKRLRDEKGKENADSTCNQDIFGMLKGISGIRADHSSSCPLFFKTYAGICIWMLPIKVSWYEAKVICESTGSQLAILNNVAYYKRILDFLKESKISSKFWIGGQFVRTEDEVISNKWRWIDDRTEVEQGAPFWSIGYEIERRNEKTFLRPKNDQNDGKCLAILDENFYFFSDEFCARKLSPLCIKEINFY